MEPAPAPPRGQAAAARLADLFVDTAIALPLDNLFPPPLLAMLLREAALTYLRSHRSVEQARTLQGNLLTFLRGRWNGPLRELVPRGVLQLLPELASRPFAPDRALVVNLLSREPFRRMMRELMMSTLTDYSRKVRATVTETGPGKGLGVLSRLASEAVKKSTSTLGTIAGGVASAVSDEFDRQMQRRTAEFADSAIDDMVGRMATMMSDPGRAPEHTALKLELLDFVLDMRGPQVAQELERLNPGFIAEQIRVTALRWLEREHTPVELAMWLTWLMNRTRDRPVGELLGGTPFLKEVRPSLEQIMAQFLRPLVENGALLRTLGEPPAPEPSQNQRSASAASPRGQGEK